MERCIARSSQGHRLLARQREAVEELFILKTSYIFWVCKNPYAVTLWI
jgi:hypothetical protein